MILSGEGDLPWGVVVWASIDDVDRFDDATKEHWRAEGVLHVPNARTGQLHPMSLAALEEVERDPQRFDILSSVERLQVPLLIVHGTDDAAVEPEAAERIAGRAPEGELLLIEGTGHAMGASHPCPAIESIPTLHRAVEATLDFIDRLGGDRERADA